MIAMRASASPARHPPPQDPFQAGLDPGQRGAAMLVIATILIALLAGGGVALYVQLQSTKGAGMVKASRTSLYCAEAGLAAARGIIVTQYAAWPLILNGTSSDDPNWYPITGDIDNPPDGVDDYEVTIRDNDDELPPTPPDPSHDNDRSVFAVARCTKNTEVSRQVVELLLVAGTGHVYRNQAGGGAFNAGNQNKKGDGP